MTREGIHKGNLQHETFCKLTTGNKTLIALISNIMDMILERDLIWRLGHWFSTFSVINLQ